MKNTKCYSVLVLSVLFMILFAFTSLASGIWVLDGNGWWWKQGSYEARPRNCWMWIDGDNNGIAECYYFNDNGYCLLNTITPDGYQVDANGAWIQNGVVQTKKVAPLPAAAGNGYIDGQAAYDKLMSLKAMYPEGTPWGDDKCYCRSVGLTDYEWYGCAAFSLMCQCQLYGKDFNGRTHMQLDHLHPGDVITMRMPAGEHMVVVLTDNGDSVTVCEGNYNNAVHWGRVIPKNQIRLVSVETVF